jgi:hypothetical protein
MSGKPPIKVVRDDALARFRLDTTWKDVDVGNSIKWYHVASIILITLALPLMPILFKYFC